MYSYLGHLRFSPNYRTGRSNAGKSGVVAALALAACVPACTATQATSAPPQTAGVPAQAVSGEPVLAIRSVRIFDGTQVIPEGTVVIRGETIAAVGADVRVPDGAEIVDGTGHTLLPGLMDAHFHADGPDAYRTSLALGVTTVMDVFAELSALGSGIPVKELGQRGPDEADSIVGPMITAPGAHGSQYAGPPVRLATTAQECQIAVDSAAAEGYRFIKLVHDGGETWSPKPVPTMSREVLAACIQAAHARGMLAVVHVMNWQKSLEALEAGADGLVHGITDVLPDETYARLAAKRGAFVVPTLAVIRAVVGRGNAEAILGNPQVAPYLPPATIKMLTSSFPDWFGHKILVDVAQRSIQQLMDAGVMVLAGSDCFNPGTAPGATLHHELELLVAAGLTPVQALAAATSLPAAAFRLSDRGRIASGLRADLLLVRGDPTTDIRATLDVAAVWKQGRRMDRDAFRAHVQAEAEAVRAANPSN